MKTIRQNRFWIFYVIFAILIVLASIPISNYFENLKNKNYFFGYVINF